MSISGVPNGTFDFGSYLTINGSGFGSTPGTVTVNGVSMVISDWTDTAIEFVISDYVVGGASVTYEVTTAALAVFSQTGMFFIENASLGHTKVNDLTFSSTPIEAAAGAIVTLKRDGLIPTEWTRGMVGVHAIDENTVYALSLGGEQALGITPPNTTLWKTTDGGATWFIFKQTHEFHPSSVMNGMSDTDLNKGDARHAWGGYLAVFDEQHMHFGATSAYFATHDGWSTFCRHSAGSSTGTYGQRMISSGGTVWRSLSTSKTDPNWSVSTWHQRTFAYKTTATCATWPMSIVHMYLGKAYALEGSGGGYKSIIAGIGYSNNKFEIYKGTGGSTALKAQYLNLYGGVQDIDFSSSGDVGLVVNKKADINPPYPSTPLSLYTSGHYALTIDGGDNWTIHDLVTDDGRNPGIYSVHCMTDTEWIIGTADGSPSWQHTKYDYGSGPEYRSHIYKTTDGGATWELKHSNLNVNSTWMDIHSSGDVVYAVDWWRAEIIKSEDRGETWVDITPANGYKLANIPSHFGYQNGFIIGDSDSDNPYHDNYGQVRFTETGGGSAATALGRIVRWDNDEIQIIVPFDIFDEDDVLSLTVENAPWMAAVTVSDFIKITGTASWPVVIPKLSALSGMSPGATVTLDGSDYGDDQAWAKLFVARRNVNDNLLPSPSQETIDSWAVGGNSLDFTLDPAFTETSARVFLETPGGIAWIDGVVVIPPGPDYADYVKYVHEEIEVTGTAMGDPAANTCVIRAEWEEDPGPTLMSYEFTHTTASPSDLVLEWTDTLIRFKAPGEWSGEWDAIADTWATQEGSPVVIPTPLNWKPFPAVKGLDPAGQISQWVRFTIKIDGIEAATWMTCTMKPPVPEDTRSVDGAPLAVEATQALSLSPGQAMGTYGTDFGHRDTAYNHSYWEEVGNPPNNDLQVIFQLPGDGGGIDRWRQDTDFLLAPTGNDIVGKDRVLLTPAVSAGAVYTQWLGAPGGRNKLPYDLTIEAAPSFYVNPPEIYYASKVEGDVYDDRVITYMGETDLYFHGKNFGFIPENAPPTGIAVVEFFDLIAGDQIPLTSGVPVPGEDWKFEYPAASGDFYHLGQGYYLGGPWSPAEPDFNQTMNPAHTWSSVPLVAASGHAFYPWGGPYVLSAGVASPTVVWNTTSADPNDPEALVTIKVEIPAGLTQDLFMMRIATPGGYDTIIFRRGNFWDLMPRLWRSIPPATYTLGTDDPRNYQLEDTAPKEPEDPGDTIDRPQFAMTAENPGDIDADTELYCVYVSSDIEKHLRFLVRAGIYDINRTGITWSLNDTLVWQTGGLIFNPVPDGAGGTTAGPWEYLGTPLATPDIIDGAPVNPDINSERINFIIYMEASFIAKLNDGDNKILVRVVDIQGNELTVPIAVIKVDAEIDITTFEPKAQQGIVYDSASGKYYSRSVAGTKDFDIEVDSDAG